MGLFSFIRRIGKAGVNEAVDFASGTTPSPSLDNPKRAYTVIVVLGLTLLIGSAWIFSKNLNQLLKKNVTNNTNMTTAIAELEALRGKDTDGDSLSDYDELFAYNSSPYLFSSAGDGTSDGVKVAKGLDPNCQEGKTCTEAPTVNLNQGADETLSADYLRQALKASGVPAATVDATADDDLLQIYQETLSTASNANITDPTVGSLTNLSGASIRSLLVQNGVDADTLSKVDDVTLEEIFAEAIANDTE